MPFEQRPLQCAGNFECKLCLAGAGFTFDKDGSLEGHRRIDRHLQIIVHEWDESAWSARKAISAVIEVRLESPTGGPVFWAARFSDRRDFADREKHHATAIGLRREALDEIAFEILSMLPPRVAKAGPAMGN